jgi:TRAP-type C4-dicarboxylate transport system permease small subunit
VVGFRNPAVEAQGGLLGDDRRGPQKRSRRDCACYQELLNRLHADRLFAEVKHLITYVIACQYGHADMQVQPLRVLGQRRKHVFALISCERYRCANILGVEIKEADISHPDGLGCSRHWSRRALLGILGMVALAMMLVTTIDVTGRYIFNAPMPGTLEVTELLLALMVFGAAPLVAADRSHITTDLLESSIRGRFRQVRDVGVALISCLACAVLGWQLLLQAAEMSSMSGSTPMLAIPIGPVLYFSAAMCAACVLIALLQAVQSLAARLPPE